MKKIRAHCKQIQRERTHYKTTDVTNERTNGRTNELNEYTYKELTK